jgi:hypothetical protein
MFTSLAGQARTWSIEMDRVNLENGGEPRYTYGTYGPFIWVNNNISPT